MLSDEDIAAWASSGKRPIHKAVPQLQYSAQVRHPTRYLYDRLVEPEINAPEPEDAADQDRWSEWKYDLPGSSMWRYVEHQFGYPTIIGVHLELYDYARFLNALADRIEATLPFISTDLGSGGSEFLTSVAGEEEMIRLNRAYTVQIADLVRNASFQVEQAAEFAVDRFST